MTRALPLDNYRELLLRAGLSAEEAERVIERVRQDMAELFGTDETQVREQA